MEFNSQVCTTKTQSERLVALGLKKETADMTLQTTLDVCYHITYQVDKLPVVWERKEVELTMQEIADKFGINVNQLRIKE